MKKKVILPENISDITLGQYQKLVEIEAKEIDNHTKNCQKVEVITGLVRHEIDSIKITDFNSIVNQIDEALQIEGEFKRRFEMKGIEFGLIPNFDKMGTDEYIDLSTYGTEIETLHNVMAILYRPIKDNGKTYTINSYNGTKGFAEAMKEIPLSYVNGALGFFLTLQNDLLKHLEKSIIAERLKEKQQATLKNGGGMQRLTKWLKGKHGNTILSLK